MKARIMSPTHHWNDPIMMAGNWIRRPALHERNHYNEATQSQIAILSADVTCLVTKRWNWDHSCSSLSTHSAWWMPVLRDQVKHSGLCAYWRSVVNVSNLQWMAWCFATLIGRKIRWTKAYGTNDALSSGPTFDGNNENPSQWNSSARWSHGGGCERSKHHEHVYQG